MTDNCNQCGGEYKRIAQHWSMSSDCSHPSLTKKQIEVATGLLMGDGNIDSQEGRNAYLQSIMVSENYLDYIDSIFGTLGKGVKLYKTSEQSAAENRQTGFSKNADAENYSDVYRWRSMTHPELQEFADWYASGKKIWPSDINLTPIVLKHWYCGDGSYSANSSNNQIRIAMSNERDNLSKVDRLFETVGLPSPRAYDVYERNSGGSYCNARFTVEQSEELWEYMGEPLPDFEYKWPKRYRKS